MNMYAGLAKAASNDKQKGLFAELSKMEEMHKVRLEEIYVNASYGEVW
jgi:rubrerythrin